MRGASPGDGTPWRTPDEQSEQVCQFTGSNQGSPMKLSACFQPVHYKCRAQPLKSQAAERHWCITAGLPSARMVKGESPGRLAENWPPREVIRKHRLKKPIPTTKILQERETDKRAICDIRPKAKDRAQETERSRRQRTGGVMSQRKCSRVQFKLRTLNTSWHFGPIFQNSFCLSQAKTFFLGGGALCTLVSFQINHDMYGFAASHCAQRAEIQNKSILLQANGCMWERSTTFLKLRKQTLWSDWLKTGSSERSRSRAENCRSDGPALLSYTPFVFVF